jgi:hypothetical protein
MAEGAYGPSERPVGEPVTSGRRQRGWMISLANETIRCGRTAVLKRAQSISLCANYAAFGFRTTSTGDGVVLSEINPHVFSGLQFPFERKIKTLVGVNSKRLKVEVKESVVSIPDGRVVFRRYDPPWLLWLYQHSQAQVGVHQPVTGGVLDVLPIPRPSSSVVYVPIAGFEFARQVP